MQRAACSLGLKPAGQGRKSNPTGVGLNDTVPAGSDALVVRKIIRARGCVNSKVQALEIPAGG